MGKAQFRKGGSGGIFYDPCAELRYTGVRWIEGTQPVHGFLNPQAEALKDVKIKALHSWDVSAKEAIDIQRRLRAMLNVETGPGDVCWVAGADVSSSKKTDAVWAGVVVFSFPGLVKMEEGWIRGKTRFPYIPGLLGFREIPPLLQVFKNLEIHPDLILCDGQGIAHPRGLGIASHLGLLLDRPAIGCAKSRLVGTYTTVGEERGNVSPLRYGEKTVGGVLRTRTGVKPLFISPGHNVTLEASLQMVLECCSKYRMPEPTREAHILVNRIRRLEETGVRA